MTRFALIISNPGEDGTDSYCAGVNIDVTNYVAFLKSPLGGSWYADEIKQLYKPSQRDVVYTLQSMSSYDYTFIVFSGHGYYSAQRESTILELSRAQEIDSLELAKGENKRTVLLDCCRVVVEDVVLESTMLRAFAETGKRLSAAQCRLYFDKHISDCPNGIITGYACSKGETAGDNAVDGGRYLSSLINAAQQWYESSKTDLSNYWYHYTVSAAHDTSVQRVQRLSGGRQNPNIDKPRSGPYFPFAIMAG